MRRSEQDGAAVRFPPPLVFVIVVAVAVVLDRSVAPMPPGLPDPIRAVVAGGALLSGAGLMIVAMALFRRSGQDPRPWKSTPEVLFKGPYRLSRNPMYLSLGMLQVGAGLLLSNGWMIVLLPLSLLGVYWAAIRHEEAYLERKFGDSYREYKSAVRRWL